jgi:hypothetical protein
MERGGWEGGGWQGMMLPLLGPADSFAHREAWLMYRSLGDCTTCESNQIKIDATLKKARATNSKID